MVGDKDNCGKNGPNYHRKVIFIDENNIHKYTIHDVVLPLPGWHTIFPANQIGVWYTELLQADGLSDEDFRRSFTYSLLFLIFISQIIHWFSFIFRMFNLSGIYRFMISKPFDVKWKFVNYEDPNMSLIQSDKERLTKKSRLHPATQGRDILSVDTSLFEVFVQGVRSADLYSNSISRLSPLRAWSLERSLRWT